MKLAKVAGTVTSTIKHGLFDGHRLLICDFVDEHIEPAAGYIIAVDTIGAAPGELVLILDEGSSARQVLGVATGPVRGLVVGIVDDVTISGEAG